MKTIEEIRLENLKTLCSQFKSQRQFALHLGKTPAQLNNWLIFDDSVENKHSRAISSSAAREIEKIMNKPRGWLDNDHGKAQENQDETMAYSHSMIE